MIASKVGGVRRNRVSRRWLLAWKTSRPRCQSIATVHLTAAELLTRVADGLVQAHSTRRRSRIRRSELAVTKRRARQAPATLHDRMAPDSIAWKIGCQARASRRVTCDEDRPPIRVPRPTPSTATVQGYVRVPEGRTRRVITRSPETEGPRSPDVVLAHHLKHAHANETGLMPIQVIASATAGRTRCCTSSMGFEKSPDPIAGSHFRWTVKTRRRNGRPDRAGA